MEAPIAFVPASGPQATEMHAGPATEHARHGGHSVCSHSSMGEVMSAGVAQLCDFEKPVAFLQGNC